MYSLEPKNWVSLYADYLLRYSMFRLNDLSRCEDLVQDTFLSALKAQHNFKGNSSEKTWLTSILKNKIIDEYRKNAKTFVASDNNENEEALLESFFELNEDGPFHWKKNQMPLDWEISAVDVLIQKEYLQVLRNCIGKLNAVQGALLQEKYFEETPSEKICKDFNITKSNYWTMMHRINLTLRKCIESNWFKINNA